MFHKRSCSLATSSAKSEFKKTHHLGFSICIALMLTACMSFPSYEVDPSTINLMPRDIAVAYINDNQTFQTCIWTETGVQYRPSAGLVSRPEPVFRSFDEHRFQYSVVRSNIYGREFWRVSVRINVPGKFLEEICTIADALYGQDRPFETEQEVIDMVSALESLGIGPERLNR